MYNVHDNIAALATVPGKSALNVVRCSGSGVLDLYLNLTLKQYCFLLSDSIAALTNSLPKNSTTSSEVQNVERVIIDTTSPEWLQTISSFENLFSFAVGNTASMLAFKKRTNRKRMACIKSAAVCFDD